MTPSDTRVWLSAAWLCMTLVTALVLEASSSRAWMLAAMAGITPVSVLLMLWNDGPPPAMADVLHATKRRR